MGKGKTFVLVLLSIILVLSMIVCIIGASLNILLYPDTYSDHIEDGEILELINETMLENLSEEESQEIIEIIEIIDLEDVAEDAFSEVLAFIRGDQDEVELTPGMDMGFIKNMLEDKVRELPVCPSIEEADKIIESLDEGNLSDLVCRPGIYSPDELVEIVLDVSGIEIPEQTEVDLADELNLESEEIRSIRRGVSIYQNIWVGALILSLLLVGIILVMNRNYLKPGFKWVGSCFVVVGVILLLISFIGMGQVESVIPEGDDTIAQFFFGLVPDVVGEVFFRVIMYSSITLFLGLFFFFIGMTPSKTLKSLERSHPSSQSK